MKRRAGLHQHNRPGGVLQFHKFDTDLPEDEFVAGIPTTSSAKVNITIKKNKPGLSWAKLSQYWLA